MKVVVEFTFIDELRVIRVNGLDFNGNLKIGTSIDGLVDLTKSTLINFSYNFKISANLFQHL
jgi:hypothetical protein